MNFNLHIHDATPRFPMEGMKPFSYAIIFSDWQAMLWWDDGSIQNAQFPGVLQNEDRDAG